MRIEHCINCGMKVVPKDDGRCPSCQTQMGPAREREHARDSVQRRAPSDHQIGTETTNEMRSARDEAPAHRERRPSTAPQDLRTPRRKDRLIVATEDSVFPNRCVKTNLPLQGEKTTLTLWYNRNSPWLALLSRAMYLSGAVKVHINVGLCDKRRRRMKILRAASWFFFSLPVLLITLLALSEAWRPRFVPDLFRNVGPIVAGTVCGLLICSPFILGVFLLWRSQILSVVSMRGGRIYLKGAHPGYLNNLPPAGNADAPRGRLV